jgi:uncharacterized protein YbjT (DUF2867 family)
MPTQAVMVGATGMVGSACLPLLLERYENVTAFVRKATGLRNARLIERVVDFGNLGTIEIPHAAHVYCALGTTIKKAGSEAAFRKVDFEYPRMLAERASEAGGTRFVLVSSAGADARSSNFYLRVKVFGDEDRGAVADGAVEKVSGDSRRRGGARDGGGREQRCRGVFYVSLR